MAKGKKELEKEQRQRNRMKELGIITFQEDEVFPEHLSHTFEQVKGFKRIEYSTYTTDTCESPHRLIWREETKCRAKRIADTAKILNEEMVSEMEFRLRIEEFVLFRFRVEIECPTCSRRLWSSDVEAKIRGTGLIATNLKDRRKNREPCTCSPERRAANLAYFELNKMFSSRADEMILYGPEEELAKWEKRRPDRILGFQHTDEFERRLNKIPRILPDGDGTKTIRETVEATVTRQKNKLLLFPFLIIEAKGEDGPGSNACDFQTALPIWKMLKIQEELQEKTKRVWIMEALVCGILLTREQVGKYLAGILRKEKTNRLLWHGYLNGVDGALQILLIVDFIFDWARDVYRPTIMSQLSDLSDLREDTLSAEADDDVWSLRGDSISNSIQTDKKDDCNLKEWDMFDPGLGVFRPAWIFESVFQCLYVTKHNVKDLLNSIPGRTADSLAIRVENSLSQNPILISENVLCMMEKIWTHKVRQQETHGLSEGENLFAVIIYHTEISREWELQRCISCAAFDREALDALQSFAKRQGDRAALPNAKEFSGKNAEDLLHDLQCLPIEANLAAAIACRRQHLEELAGSPSSKPTFEFVETHSTDTSRPCLLVESELVSPIYNWRRKASSPQEPTDSYLRFSRHSAPLKDTIATPTVSSYFMDSVPSQEEKYVLVHQKRGDRRWSRHSLCLYQIKPTEEPPSKKALAKALLKATKDDVVYCLNGRNNWKAQQRLIPATPGEPEKVRTIAKEWLQEVESLLLETEHSPKSSSPTSIDNASEQSMFQKIRHKVSQLELAIAGKAQPEQNPHMELEHVLTANADALAKVDEQRTSKISPSHPSSPSSRSDTPSPLDSKVTTTPLSTVTPSPSPSSLEALSGSSKRPIESEDDENLSPVHKKARTH
ncbi:hypothetical protein EG329_009516 [Mollisiaceae sp. DMI_Dod_QoI]|nr:hypothetical protein EG329_009516 [Helotiales sp. DMI_Dod_QoI]